MSSPSPRRSSSAPVINIEPSDHELSDQAEQAMAGAGDPTEPTPKTRRRSRPMRRAYSQPHRGPKPSPKDTKWKEEWEKAGFKDGRVLLLDLISRDFSEDGKRRILAHEFHDAEQLGRFYKFEAPKRTPALRIIHVQNSRWARAFLLRKFNIFSQDVLIGTSFGDWAAWTRPQKRAGRPVLNGKAFRNQRDPWRGISRCAFGLDYLKYYSRGKCKQDKDSYKMMELNGFDLQGDPAYMNDVYVQRLSVYIQKNEGELKMPTDPDLRNPYNREDVDEYEYQKRRYSVAAEEAGLHKDDYFPILKSLDNGSTIIIFEDSVSGEMNDCLIGARQEVENRWRNLTYYLPKQELDEDRLALECMSLVLNDILKTLTTSWDKYLHKSAAHVSILEDKIYEQPADESRAPELWMNSSTWLKVERLVYTHQDIVKETVSYLRILFDDEPEGGWLGGTVNDFERIEHLVQEDLVKPTDSLNDLMYKSVGIRDSRHSLQLSTSMWRLSWITFIFLPLTFVVGFFGMNVDTFQNDPSIKWWFIVSVPMMLLVLALWYLVKHLLARSRQDPLLRGTYEHLFHDLSVDHPELWDRDGPRRDVRGKDRLSKVRWHLLQKWFQPSKTIAARGYDQNTDGMGAWQRCKRALALQWLNEIKYEQIPLAELAQPPDRDEYLGAQVGAPGSILEALTPVTNAAIAEAEPEAARRLSPPPSARRSRLSRRAQSPRQSPNQSPKARPASQASSGSCMITEEQIGSGEDYSAGSSGSGNMVEPPGGSLAVPIGLGMGGGL